MSTMAEELTEGDISVLIHSLNTVNRIKEKLLDGLAVGDLRNEIKTTLESNYSLISKLQGIESAIETERQNQIAIPIDIRNSQLGDSDDSTT